MDRSRYPQDWEVIALEVKTDAGWCCEKCGKPCRLPKETKTELAKRLKGTEWEPLLYEQLREGGRLMRAGRFTLTCAHLNHDPADCDKDNLRAWCAPCHGRYDITADAIAIKQLLKQGCDQLPLFQ